MRGMRAFLLIGVVSLALGGDLQARPLPAAPGCTIFPHSSPWNRRVDRLPVDPSSKAVLATVGLDSGLHADFGSGLWQGRSIGIPITIVNAGTRRVRVRFQYGSESDRGPYPIPRGVRIEGGSDRHAVVVDRSSCRLYELYALRRTPSGWTAGSGAIWNLRSNRLRPAGWTSADAAGLPILPGLARYDELARGGIDHALRFTVERTRRAYVYPARHFASDLTDPDLPPMGLRVRLRADFDTSVFPPQARSILETLKRYGMIVADNGAPWYVSGAPDPRWSNDDLHTLVDTSSLRPRAPR
jgi:hypothetical protein